MTTQVVAQGIAKTVAVAKQTGKGVPASTGGQYKRRVNYVATADRDSFDNNEINTHQQSVGSSYGLKKVSAKMQGLLSAGAYSLEFSTLLRKDFATGATTGAIVTVTSASLGLNSIGLATGTYTRSAGSYLTDGFKVGDIVRPAGFATTGAINNAANQLITALTATVMTVMRFDATLVGAKAAGDSVTIALPGKKTMAPLTGHTKNYLSYEDWYADLTKSELFSDMVPAKADIASPATGNVTINIDFTGLVRQRAEAQVLNAAAVATTANPNTGINGAVFINGVAYANVSNMKLTIDGTVAQGDATIGQDFAFDISRGRIKVSGEFDALFTDDAFQIIYDGETPIQIVGVMMVNNGDPLSDFVTFNMGRIKIFGDAPDDGEKLIMRTYPFTAEINVNGGAALANDQTILSVQDTQAA